jgi:hypothetical protein
LRIGHITQTLLAAVLFLAVQSVHAQAAVTTDDFCVRVQQLLAGTGMIPDSNTVYTDYQAFRASKTGVRPLTNHQYVMLEPGVPNSPMRVSCKIKTPDHLNAEYGPGTANDQALGCIDVNRDTARRVYAGLNSEEIKRVRFTATRLVFEPDISTFMGSSWVGEFPFAWTGPDGQLHLQAKRLRVDWDNVWLSWAPDRLRGALYCHLVAPEYLRRLVLGAATAPTLEE